MSPFRKILAARGVRHPAAYSIIIVMLGMLVSMTVAVVISVQASNRAIAHQEAIRQEQAAQSRAASCAFITTIRDAYLEDPPNPPTKTYKTITQAWVDLAKNCE
jgi:type II secretory pathway pseudopilin PulG